MIAINPKVPSLKSRFVKRFLFGSCCVIRDFTKGHFIDDSNEYKFKCMFHPASSSSEKNTFSTTAGFLIFSGESLSRSNRSLDKRFDLRFDLPCDRSLHPVSHAHVTNCCD